MAAPQWGRQATCDVRADGADGVVVFPTKVANPMDIKNTIILDVKTVRRTSQRDHTLTIEGILKKAA